MKLSHPHLRTGSVALLILVAVGAASAEGRSRPIDSARAAKLHKLAGDILPARARSSRRDEARALRSALDALSTSISETEARPSAARLTLLGSRRRRAEAALSDLRRRMNAGGASENAAELSRLFAPLWTDIDEALAAAPGRRGKELSEARGRLAKARSHATDVHGTSFVALPLVEHR